MYFWTRKFPPLSFRSHSHVATCFVFFSYNGDKNDIQIRQGGGSDICSRLFAAVEVYYTAVVYTPINYCLWILFSAIVIAIAASLVFIWYSRQMKERLHRRRQLLKRRRNAVQYAAPQP